MNESDVDAPGVYLYCFARSGMVPGIAAAGIGGAERVATLDVGAVAAVWSRVSLGEFCGEPAETNLKDLAWLGPRACQHEGVIEAVMRHSPVLPVRFGSVFSSEGALAKLMTARNEELSQFLGRVSGKEEWGVKGYVESEQAAKGLLSNDPALAEQQGSLSDSPGTRYFQEKKLRSLAEERLKAFCRAAAGQIHDELAGRAVEACRLTTRARGLSDHEAAPVLNSAFLVLGGRVADFLECVETINATYAQRGLKFVVSGPWPPYNFCPSIDGIRQAHAAGSLSNGGAAE